MQQTHWFDKHLTCSYLRTGFEHLHLVFSGFCRGFTFERKSVASKTKFDSGVSELAAGRHVLVYPGGGWESCRPSRERNQELPRNSG